MRLAGLVEAVHGAFDVPAAMADVAAICEHDRYQASAGIHAAAAYVADRAADAGLVDVEILHFLADGARRWWTFAAPMPWTPRRASLHLDGVPILHYPDQPYALAANSAPTPPRRLRLVRWSAAHRPDPSAAIVVLHDTHLPSVLAELVSRGAAGVVTDPLATPAHPRPVITGSVDSGCGEETAADSSGDHAAEAGATAARWRGQVGRIELPGGCPLFAFSVTGEQLDVLCRAAERGASAHVDVDVDQDAGTFPVVTGWLPGTAGATGTTVTAGELLLSAHLCHPRPSANDNASGVAALLGIARAHGVLGGGRALRFVWGPEFVGMAAYLHDRVHAGRAPMPVAAVNVDMAGEDQRRCGGPLVIERAPDELPSPLSAIAERCAALVPARARSYSGAAPSDTWAWRATPYVGASDHAMPAGRPTGCPAISLGHWPDDANHTSADTIELVDPDELRRTATIAGATVAALRGLGHGSNHGLDDGLDHSLNYDDALAADVAAATVAWAANHVLSALPGSRATAPRPVAGPALDPWAPEHAARLLDHRAIVAANTVRSLRITGVPRNAVEWITGLAAHARALHKPGQPGQPPASDARPEPDDADVLSARWDGPMNLRHLAECAGQDDRRWLAAMSAHDRGGSYARLLALARGLDGHRDRMQVAWWAALTSELAIPLPIARRFLRLLCRTGLARPTRPRTGDA